jgi:Arc/MetJ-type ribon-helix-helix transcriptional regulator
MTITLPEETLRTAEAQAAAGGYANVNDYVRALVEAAAANEADIDAAFEGEPELSETEEHDAVVAALRRSEEDVAAGRVRPAEDVFGDIAARYGIILPEVR